MDDLRIGTRVCHRNYTHKQGTVVQSPYGEGNVRVQWDDGKVGDLEWRAGVAHSAWLLDVLAKEQE